jgi:hypothetical protein
MARLDGHDDPTPPRYGADDLIVPEGYPDDPPPWYGADDLIVPEGYPDDPPPWYGADDLIVPEGYPDDPPPPWYGADDLIVPEGYPDDPDPPQDRLGGREVDDQDRSGEEERDQPQITGIAPSELENTREHQENDVLSWILPQLSYIEDECDVLLDSGKTELHNEAAKNIITCLAMGTRRILDLNLEVPRATRGPDRLARFDRELLHGVGMLLDRHFKHQKLPWPPPLPEPPPAVVRDLIEMYDEAARRSTGAGRGANDETLNDVLGRVARQSQDLLDNWSAAGVTAATAAAQPAGEAKRSIIGVFLTGAALVISLLQGPGAMHNFARDVQDLGGDVSEVAETVSAGFAGALDRIADHVLNTKNQARAKEAPSRAARSANGYDRESGPREAGMREILNTLEASAERIPIDELALAADNLDAAINGLTVLAGSIEESGIAEAASHARQNVREAQQSASDLREAIRSWIERNS